MAAEEAGPTNSRTNVRGISLVRAAGDDALTYAYGSRVDLKIELDASNVDGDNFARTDKDRATKEEWQVVVVPRMARPTTEEPPILAMPLDSLATADDDSDMGNVGGGGRGGGGWGGGGKDGRALQRGGGRCTRRD